MTRLTLTLALAGLLLSVPGCGDSHDAVMQDTIEIMKDMTEVMESIEDEASAKAAAPKLAKLGERFREIEMRQEAVGKPTPEQEQALKEKYGDELESVMQEFMAETFRLMMNPALAKHLEDAMPKPATPSAGG